MFFEKITGPLNIQVYGLLGYELFFEKFVKPSAPSPSYILNVRSLKCLFVTSHTLHFTLFASTLLRISFAILFLTLFSSYFVFSYLQKYKIKKNIFKENHKKYCKL